MRGTIRSAILAVAFSFEEGIVVIQLASGRFRLAQCFQNRRSWTILDFFREGGLVLS